jgi:hypothetical protein
MDPYQQLLSAFRAYLERFSEPVIDFLEPIDWDMPPRMLAARTLPVTAHLVRCVELSSEIGRPLANLLAASAADLCWGQTYSASDFGESFLARYGWVELFGTRGHFANDAIAGGFLLLGPNITYPDHHHIAEEIYIPLTGQLVAQGRGVLRDEEGGRSDPPSLQRRPRHAHGNRALARALSVARRAASSEIGDRRAGRLITWPVRSPSANRCRTTRHGLPGRRR